jgi:class 3 adenylate cyclase/DNA-binding winged helix-turn-helix (wHTH) protein/predicted ATPase
MRYVFDDYVLDIHSAEHSTLRQAGALVRIEPRALNLLTYLVQHAGRTVTKEQLLERLWPNRSVGDDSLANAVAYARKALGDTGRTQRYIKNVFGEGYCFIARLDIRQQPATDAPSLPVHGTLTHRTEHNVDEAVPGSSLATVPSTSQFTSPPARASMSPQRAAAHAMLTAERRQLTVLVGQLAGVSADAAPLDPEVLHEVASDYQALCTDVVCRFGGHLAECKGDQVVGYFGYPQAHEDDAWRAVQTGLELMAAIAECSSSLKNNPGMRLAVRVGIDTGVVVVEGMGHGDARKPVALGAPPHIAAQLQGLAAPNTVLISPATLRLVKGYVEYQALGVYEFPDVSPPLTVYQVRQECAAQSRFAAAVTTGLTPLVGRQWEVELLHERWAQAKDKRGQVVVLGGESGIGKSRLVHVLKEQLVQEAHTLIECHGSPYYQQSAFYPIIEHIRRCLDLRHDDTAEATVQRLEGVLASFRMPLAKVLPLFAALLSLPLPARYAPLPLSSDQQKQQTFTALLAWLRREAERQPLCVIIEELHWVDPSTLEWLSLVINEIPSARILLLLTCRPEFQPPWTMRSHCTHLALGRFSQAQVATMIDRLTGGKALPTEVLQHLMATTDGVPLFVEELTKMVIESGLVTEREERYELTRPLPRFAIPTTLQGALMARLDRSGAAKQVAQLGAVIGREFTYEVLQAVAPMEEATIQQGLAQLVGAELLYQSGMPPQAQYTFKHALIQEAAYHSLLRRSRRHAHQQIALVLTERFPDTCARLPELVAHHYTEAGLSAQGIPYWQRAGERAIQRSTHTEAVNHLTTGLKVLTTLPETRERHQQELTLRLALSQSLMATKGWAALEVEDSHARVRELCQQVGDTRQLFQVVRGWRALYLHRAELQRARELSEELLQLAEGQQDTAFRVVAHDKLGETLAFMGFFRDARAQAEAGLDLYTQQPLASYWHTGGHDPSVSCHAWLSWTLWMLGYPSQAVQQSQAALQRAHELAHPPSVIYALGYAAFLAQLRRAGSTAQGYAEAIITLSTEHGFAHWVAYGMALRGCAAVCQGRCTEGIAQLHEGLARRRAVGATMGHSWFLAQLAEAYQHSGQPEAGLSVVAEALVFVAQTGEVAYAAELHRLKGEFLQMAPSDATGESETCLHQALAIASQQQAKALELRAAMSLSRLWHRQGKRAAARRLLADVYSWFTEGFDTADLQEAKVLLEVLSC